MRGNNTTYPIWIKFCRMIDIPDISTNFGDDRLRGLWVAGRGGGSNFTIFISLSSSSLQHSRATVQVYDTHVPIPRRSELPGCSRKVVRMMKERRQQGMMRFTT